MTTVAGGGFFFERVSVGGTWRWTVRAANIQGAGQSFQVVDILTPFGRMTDASIPLPGDVVISMAESIVEYQQQLAPRLALATGVPSSFAVTVTEGDAPSLVGEVIVVNSGAFGSFMDATATSGSPWLTVSGPVRGLGKNQTGRFTIRVLAQSLLAVGSPHSAVVFLQDGSGNAIPVSVSVTVLPRPSVAVSSLSVGLSYSISTMVASGAQQLDVSNSGPAGSVLSATVAKVQNCSPWLSVSPLSVGPLASGESSQVTFSVLSAGAPSVPGTYTEIVAVSSRGAGGSPQNVTVTLTVTA